MPETLAIYLLLILAAGFIGGAVCRRLGVSLLVGYLLAGTIVGRFVPRIVGPDQHDIDALAEAGVLLLLFSVGLEFSLDDLLRRGRTMLLAGTLQMLLAALPVAGALMLAGVGWRTSLLIGSAVSLSSTVLVFKALAEWGQVGTPQGRRAVGVLLFQDVALVPLLLLLPILTGEGAQPEWIQYLRLALVSVGVVAAVILLRWAVTRFAVPWLVVFKSPELIVLFTVALLGSTVFAVYRVGLPAPLGAFAAGLIFNGNRLSRQVDALVLPFRELFAAVFFVSLGMILDPDIVRREPIVIPGLVTMIAVKALAATLALRATGLGWRSASGIGLGLSQIGEFSFVLLLEGFRQGIISEPAYQRMLFMAMGSLILTPQLLRIGFRHATGYQSADEVDEDRMQPWRTQDLKRAIVIGAGPIGRMVVSRLEIAGVDACLIDLSPVNLHSFAQQGFDTVAGDATDPAVLQQAGIDQSSIVVVTVPADKISLEIVRTVRAKNPKVRILARCRFHSNRGPLLQAGADNAVSEEIAASGAIIDIVGQWLSQQHEH